MLHTLLAHNRSNKRAQKQQPPFVLSTNSQTTTHKPLSFSELLLQLVFGASPLHLPQISPLNAISTAHNIQEAQTNGKIVVKLDCKNAFNVLSRARIATEVYATYQFPAYLVVVPPLL